MKGRGKGEATLEMPPEDEQGKEAGLGRILILSRPEWCWLFAGLFVLLLSLVPLLILPLFFGIVVDGIQDADTSTAEKKAFVSEKLTVLLMVLLVGSLASFLRTIIFNGAGERVVSRLRIQLFHAIIRQEIGMFDRRKTGELISRLTADTTSLQDVATSNVSMFIRGLVQIVVSAGLMFFNSWRLALLILLVVPFCMLLVTLYSPIVSRIATKYTDRLGESNNIAQESIANVRTMRSFAAEDVESQKYRAAIGDPDDRTDTKCCWYPATETAYKAGIQKQISAAFFLAFVTFLFMTAMVVVLWYGTFEVIDGNLTLGNLSSFILYAVQIAGSIGTMVGLANSLYSAKGASKRTFQLIDREPAVPVAGGDTPESMDGFISFENVTFSYPTRPEVNVMNNFSLDIPKDATVAFVGSSGAGKSTVLSLIQRFYDVTSGRILLDGRPLADLDPSWVRRQFAFVQQEPVLFGASIAANIGYGYAVKMGSPDARLSQEQMEAVAKDAYCHDFIMSFPEGYQTVVGERGVRLSGGQKQRVAIARALLMNPRVLLLDEATSALDAESEAIVAQAIEKAMVGRTTVIVAHRLSTVKRADQIVLVEKGSLVDKGKHEELLQRCAKYEELVRRQLASGTAAADEADRVLPFAAQSSGKGHGHMSQENGIEGATDAISV